MRHYNRRSLYYDVVRLRMRITPAEREMMRMLRYLGVKYKFQKAFKFSKKGYYIVDFYLPEYRTVIEVDGSQHLRNPKQEAYDEKRTRFLEERRKLRVIRFTNKDILRNPNVVTDLLESYLSEFL